MRTAPVRRLSTRLRHLYYARGSGDSARIAAGTVGLVLAGLLAGVAVVAALPATARMARHVVAGGGGRSTSPSYHVEGTVGQAVTGSSAGPGLRLLHGFWPVPAAPSPAATATGPTPSPTTVPATSTPQDTATAAATVTPGGIGRWEVNTTGDTDDGTCDSTDCSLREALYAANSHPGPDTVRFAIPAGDPGCATDGVCTIRPITRLPELYDDQTTLDGFTQAGAAPNAAAFGDVIDARLRIVLDGSALAPSDRYTAGLDIRATGTVVRGLVIHGYYTGIDLIQASHSRIEGNFVGVDAAGMTAPGNRCVGVSVSGLEGATGSSQNVVGGSSPSARNLIAGNGCNGVSLGPAGANTVQGNYIGTDATGARGLPNEAGGVRAFNSSNNRIGGAGADQSNLIAFNRTAGVIVDAFSQAADGNTIQQNRIHSNEGPGIGLEGAANGGIGAPVIDTATVTRVAGTACPGCRVEVFSDAGSQGAILEGLATADAAGRWALDRPGGFHLPNLTATATDAQGNTSAFSAPAALPGATATVTPTRAPTSGTPGGPTATPRGPTPPVSGGSACLPWVGKRSAP